MHHQCGAGATLCPHGSGFGFRVLGSVSGSGLHARGADRAYTIAAGVGFAITGLPWLLPLMTVPGSLHLIWLGFGMVYRPPEIRRGEVAKVFLLIW